MELQHGHIYFVEFDPSSGHEFQKTRPAVIISSNDLIKRSHLITCIPFTGNTSNTVDKDDVLVKKNTDNNLYCDSVLKTQHISTFDKRRVLRYVGILADSALHSLKDTIIRNYHLNS